MFKIDIYSEEDCYLIYNNCKSIWKSDGTIGGNIDFLIEYYAESEDFPVTLKYIPELTELSFEECYESATMKYTREFKTVDEFLNYLEELKCKKQ